MNELTFQNGDRMPALGLGTWKSDPGVVGRAVSEALDIGYRHIDCAAIYGNEAEIGETLQGAITAGRIARDDLWITSKLWCNRHREDDVEPAIRETLANLRLEFLDLYLVHWPVAVKPDVMVPEAADDFFSLDEVSLEETWRGMQRVLELGLARHIGVSNYSAKKLAAHSGFDVRPEMNQVELHPYLQQHSLVDGASALGAHVTAYSPLGSGDRPDSMRSEDDPVLLEDPAIASIATRIGATPAQVLIAWAIQRGTAVIPKSTNPKRMAENFAAAEFSLDHAAMLEITALDRRRRYVDGAFWSRAGGPYPVDELWDESPATRASS
ncbi:MAG: aldo/keto reductase [Planctomycetota bacterium]